ncbi:MAG: hypothetical protein ACI391_09095 [Muribaculaceae bacterium]
MIQLLQVSYDVSSEKTLKRELRGLVNASKKFKCDDLLLITADQTAFITSGGKTIHIVKATDWLLSTPQ